MAKQKLTVEKFMNLIAGQVASNPTTEVDVETNKAVLKELQHISSLVEKGFADKPESLTGNILPGMFNKLVSSIKDISKTSDKKESSPESLRSTSFFDNVKRLPKILEEAFAKKVKDFSFSLIPKAITSKVDSLFTKSSKTDKEEIKPKSLLESTKEVQKVKIENSKEFAKDLSPVFKEEFKDFNKNIVDVAKVIKTLPDLFKDIKKEFRSGQGSGGGSPLDFIKSNTTKASGIGTSLTSLAGTSVGAASTAAVAGTVAAGAIAGYGIGKLIEPHLVKAIDKAGSESANSHQFAKNGKALVDLVSDRLKEGKTPAGPYTKGRAAYDVQQYLVKNSEKFKASEYEITYFKKYAQKKLGKDTFEITPEAPISNKPSTKTPEQDKQRIEANIEATPKVDISKPESKAPEITPEPIKEAVSAKTEVPKASEITPEPIKERIEAVKEVPKAPEITPDPIKEAVSAKTAAPEITPEPVKENVNISKEIPKPAAPLYSAPPIPAISKWLRSKPEHLEAWQKMSIKEKQELTKIASSVNNPYTQARVLDKHAGTMFAKHSAAPTLAATIEPQRQKQTSFIAPSPEATPAIKPAEEVKSSSVNDKSLEEIAANTGDTNKTLAGLVMGFNNMAKALREFGVNVSSQPPVVVNAGGKQGQQAMRLKSSQQASAGNSEISNFRMGTVEASRFQPA